MRLITCVLLTLGWTIGTLIVFLFLYNRSNFLIFTKKYQEKNLVTSTHVQVFKSCIQKLVALHFTNLGTVVLLNTNVPTLVLVERINAMFLDRNLGLVHNFLKNF